MLSGARCTFQSLISVGVFSDQAERGLNHDSVSGALRMVPQLQCDSIKLLACKVTHTRQLLYLTGSMRTCAEQAHSLIGWRGESLDPKEVFPDHVRPADRAHLRQGDVNGTSGCAPASLPVWWVMRMPIRCVTEWSPVFLLLVCYILLLPVPALGAPLCMYTHSTASLACAVKARQAWCSCCSSNVHLPSPWRCGMLACSGM